MKLFFQHFRTCMTICLVVIDELWNILFFHIKTECNKSVSLQACVGNIETYQVKFDYTHTNTQKKNTKTTNWNENASQMSETSSIYVLSWDLIRYRRRTSHIIWERTVVVCLRCAAFKSAWHSKTNCIYMVNKERISELQHFCGKIYFWLRKRLKTK